MKTIVELSKNMSLPNGYVLLDYVLNKELKQSAIEDIRKLQKKKETLNPIYNQSILDYDEYWKIIGQIKYIKEKFDISEKDLINAENVEIAEEMEFLEGV